MDPDVRLSSSALHTGQGQRRGCQRASGNPCRSMCQFTVRRQGVRPNSSENMPLWQCLALEHPEVTLSRGVTLAPIARTLSQGQFEWRGPNHTVGCRLPIWVPGYGYDPRLQTWSVRSLAHCFRCAVRAPFAMACKCSQMSRTASSGLGGSRLSTARPCATSGPEAPARYCHKV